MKERELRVINLRRIPDEMHKRIKMVAILKGITIEQLALDAINKYLDKERKLWER